MLGTLVTPREMSNSNWSERRAFLENLCAESGGRMGCKLADELDELREDEDEYDNGEGVMSGEDYGSHYYLPDPYLD